MPANDKHIAWMIHVDLVEGVREKLVEYCQTLPALICCEENGEETGKPHVHILAVLPEPTSKQTLGNRLKKILPVSGPQFSFVCWEDFNSPDPLKATRAQQYVCKGPSKSVKSPPIVLHKNWLDDELVHHEAYWQRWGEITAENKDKIKKMSYNDQMVAEIIEEIRVDPSADTADIFALACKKILKRKKGRINDHVAFPLIQSIEYHFSPTQVTEAFYDRMLKKKNNY